MVSHGLVGIYTGISGISEKSGNSRHAKKLRLLRRVHLWLWLMRWGEIRHKPGQSQNARSAL
eukprot:scaffold355580_cov41-Prasinocladus_malaysianus.AAC.3